MVLAIMRLCECFDLVKTDVQACFEVKVKVATVQRELQVLGISAALGAPIKVF